MHDASGLIERERELAELGRHAAAARAGRGGVVLVTGEAGVGKTALVQASLAEAGLPLLSAAAAQHSSESYAPVATLLRARLRADPLCLERLGPLAVYLRVLLPELGPAQAPDTPTGVVDALAEWMLSLGAVDPVAVFLDDLHWADTATIDLVPRVAGELRRVPVLLVAAYRSDEVTRHHPLRKMRVRLRRAGRLAEVALEPLSARGVAELAGRALGAAVAPSLATVLHDRTEGIPFFVEELAAALAAEGRAVDGPDGLELPSGEDVPVPDSVRDAVLVRVEELPEPVRRSLEAASVVGLRFDLDLVEALAGRVDLTEAVARGLVVEVAPGVAAFRHALTREAVYLDLPWLRRRDLHRRAADLLEERDAPPGTLAAHLLACRELDRARHALLSAAERSCAVHAYRDAARSIRQALEIWPTGADEDVRLDAVARLAECAELSGELVDAARLWEELVAALDGGGDRLRLAQVRRRLGLAYRLLGRRDRSAACRARAVEDFVAAGALGDAVEERFRLAWDREEAPGGEAFAVLDEAERDATSAGRPDLVARAMGHRAHLLARRGRFQEATELARRAVEIARSSAVESALFHAYWDVAAIGMTRADYAGAYDALEQAGALCRSAGMRPEEHLCIACMGKMLMKQGDWDRAYALAGEVLVSRDDGPLTRWQALWTVGLIDVARGRTRRGRPRLAEVYALGGSRDFPPARIEGLYGLALADDIDGDAASAARRYLELARSAGLDTRDLHHFAATLRWAAAFFGASGDAAHVRVCVDALARVADRFASPDALASLSLALGEASLLEGNREQAAAELARSLELLAEIDAPFETALTKVRAGKAFAAAGEREAAVAHLVDAYRTFSRLDARPLAIRTATQLAELGERVERRLGKRAAGAVERGGLTPRELEVLGLVAAGRTNREIARELFLSHRTVDMHVRNLLGKLGCRTRTQATTKALRLGLLESRPQERRVPLSG